jgi:hypothetical protein
LSIHDLVDAGRHVLEIACTLSDDDGIVVTMEQQAGSAIGGELSAGSFCDVAAARARSFQLDVMFRPRAIVFSACAARFGAVVSVSVACAFASHVIDPEFRTPAFVFHDRDSVSRW